MKKTFSVKTRKPPLRLRHDLAADGAYEETGSYDKSEIFRKSEQGGSVSCNFRYGAAAMQGFRPCMQDDFACSPSENIKGDHFGYFSVFDGHGRYGEVVSLYCAENFMNIFLNRKCLRKGKNLSCEILTYAMKKTFAKFDNLLLQAVLRYSSSGIGREKKISFIFSGSTATIALIFSKYIVVANAGDSRTILCSNGGVNFTTMDHNPGVEVEDKRIKAAGGNVYTTPSKHKVILDPEAYANLAVSRALGDYGFKKSPTLPVEDQIVSPIPDVSILQRDNSDEFLLLASDGVFKAMSNAEVVAFVYQQMTITDDLPAICRNLIAMAYYFQYGAVEWSISSIEPDCIPDDITVVIVKLSDVPVVSKAAKQKEEVLVREALEAIRVEVDKIVAAAETKRLLDNEFHIIQQLVSFLPTKYNVQLRADFIKQLIKEGRERHFGAGPLASNNASNGARMSITDKIDEVDKDKADVLHTMAADSHEQTSEVAATNSSYVENYVAERKEVGGGHDRSHDCETENNFSNTPISIEANQPSHTLAVAEMGKVMQNANTGCNVDDLCCIPEDDCDERVTIL